MTWVCTECGQRMSEETPPLRCHDCGEASFVRWQLGPERRAPGPAEVPGAGLANGIRFPNGGLFSPSGVWS